MEVEGSLNQTPGFENQQRQAPVQIAPRGMEGVSVQLEVHPSSHTVHVSMHVPAESGDADMATAERDETEASAVASDPLQALHQEILCFAQQAAPDAAELSLKQAALQEVQQACRHALGDNKRMCVQLFGSAAHGISLRGSDLDVVITSFITPVQHTGFTPKQKEFVGQSLRRISDALVRSKAVAARPFVIYNARVPVAKMEMANGVHADITIGSEDGPRAAAFLQQQQEIFPSLRPLCMVVKSLLQRASRHEGAKGGIGTWACCNLGLAFLQEQRKAGCDTSHLGHLLLGFLKFYGRVFDTSAQAVAVGRGGLVPRAKVPGAGGEGAVGVDPVASRPATLCIEDPITGRDVTSGAHQFPAVRQLFSDASAKLELLSRVPSAVKAGLLPTIMDTPPQTGGPGRGRGMRGRSPASLGRGRGVGRSGSATPGLLKRGREGGEAPGQRKGGPGPRLAPQQPGYSTGRGRRQSQGCGTAVHAAAAGQFAAPQHTQQGAVQRHGDLVQPGQMLQQQQQGIPGYSAPMLLVRQPQQQGPVPQVLRAQQTHQGGRDEFAAGTAGGLVVIGGTGSAGHILPGPQVGGVLQLGYGQQAQHAQQQLFFNPAHQQPQAVLGQASGLYQGQEFTG